MTRTIAEVLVFTLFFALYSLNICPELSIFEEESAKPVYALRQQIAEQRKVLNVFWREEADRKNRGARTNSSINSKENRRGKVNRKPD